MIRNLYTRIKHDYRGGSLLFILVFGSIAVSVIIMGVASYALFENSASTRKHNRDLAFHIAEAGVNYYRWHLAHDSEDFTDGTGEPGPYVHEYKDKDGNLLGYFSLDITPPATGTTIAMVKSTGWTTTYPESTRSIQVRLGFPSLTDYTFIENTNMIFSNTTEVHGKVHSNGGIEFNGVTDASVESAQETYWNGSGWYDGVWGAGGPTEFFTYPVPAVDFNAVSADLAALMDLADDGGLHLYSSGEQGWHIVFLDDGTFDLYLVESLWCYLGALGWWWEWLCYDINEETFQYNQAIPDNGAIFVEDSVWVEGTIDGRVTVGAGRFPVQPTTYQNIFIPNNIVYEEKASDDVLGLIAQGDIIVPHAVPNEMEIDAAALSQFEKIFRPYYHPWYSQTVRDSLLFFGSQISYDGGGWKVISGGSVISGFINTNHSYDGNLRYFPPPSFPVEPTYDLISWEEVEE